MSICISVTEAIKHGCPACNFRSSSSHLSGRGASVCSCGECSQSFIVLSDGLEVSPFGQPDSEGNTVYPELQEHPKKDGLARGRTDNPPVEGEWFSSRGMGLDVTNGCIFCNEEHDRLVNNISGFIRTKAAGDRLLEWFNKGQNTNPLERIGVRLDYREGYPDRIQFKIGACKKHEKNLELLSYYTGLTSTITKEYLEKSKNLTFPVLKEALSTYLNKERTVSEDYYKEDNTNDFQKGKIESFNVIENYIKDYKKSSIKFQLKSYMRFLKENSEEIYDNTYIDYDNRNHYERGKIDTFRQMDWFIDGFTMLTKKKKKKY